MFKTHGYDDRMQLSDFVDVSPVAASAYPFEWENHWNLGGQMTEWARLTWEAGVPLFIVSLYVVLVFAGKEWMRSRPAFEIKTVWKFWNLGLAVFSFFGVSLSRTLTS